MKKLLVSALALAAMSSVASAGPAPLNDRQLDKIAAGDFAIVTQIAASSSHATCILCLGATGITAASKGGLAASSGLAVTSSASSTNVAVVHQ